MDRAEAIVREHRQAVDALARALVRRLVLEAWEAYSILALHGVEIPGTVLKAASKEGRAAA